MDDNLGCLVAAISAWLVCGLIGMSIGQKRGFGQGKAFLVGFLLGPLSFLMTFAKPELKKCPSCAEWIKPEAKVCPKCQRDQPEENPTDATP